MLKAGYMKVGGTSTRTYMRSLMATARNAIKVEKGLKVTTIQLAKVRPRMKLHFYQYLDL